MESTVGPKTAFDQAVEDYMKAYAVRGFPVPKDVAEKELTAFFNGEVASVN